MNQGRRISRTDRPALEQVNERVVPEALKRIAAKLTLANVAFDMGDAFRIEPTIQEGKQFLFLRMRGGHVKPAKSWGWIADE